MPVFPSAITHDQASLCISCSLAKNATRSVAKSLPVAKPGYTVKGYPRAISHLLRQRLAGIADLQGEEEFRQHLTLQGSEGSHPG